MSRDYSEELQHYLTGLSGEEVVSGSDQLETLTRNCFLQRMVKLAPKSMNNTPVAPPSSKYSSWPETHALQLQNLLQDHPELLWETALLTARRNRSLPWPVYPPLFERLEEVKNDAALSLYERALGSIGRWVCSHHPDYYIFGPTTDDWVEGALLERLAWMRQMRQLNIDNALDQMQQWMEHEKAEFRHLILDLIESVPDEKDLELLRSCTDDRSKKIRKRALLLRLQLEDETFKESFKNIVYIKTEGLARLEINPDAIALFLHENGLRFGIKQSPDLFDLCSHASPKWWIHTSWKKCRKAIQSHKQSDRLMASLAWAGLYHDMDSLSISAVQQMFMRCDATVLVPFGERKFIRLLSPKVFKTLSERWLKREQEIVEHPLCLDWLQNSRLFWSGEMTRMFFYRFKYMLDEDLSHSIEDMPYVNWLRSAGMRSNPDLVTDIRRILEDAFIPYKVEPELQEMYDLMKARQQLRSLFAKIDKDL